MRKAKGLKANKRRAKKKRAVKKQRAKPKGNSRKPVKKAKKAKKRAAFKATQSKKREMSKRNPEGETPMRGEDNDMGLGAESADVPVTDETAPIDPDLEVATEVEDDLTNDEEGYF